MDGDKGPGEEDCTEEIMIVRRPDAGVEPHTVMVEYGDAFIAIFAVHGLRVDVGLAYPAIFGFEGAVAVSVGVSVGFFRG